MEILGLPFYISFDFFLSVIDIAFPDMIFSNDGLLISYILINAINIYIIFEVIVKYLYDISFKIYNKLKNKVKGYE